jgi:hypothetical protein
MGRYNKYTLAGHNAPRSKRARPIPFMQAHRTPTGVDHKGAEVKEAQDKVIEAAKNAWEIHEQVFRNFLLECLEGRGLVFHNNEQFEKFVAESVTCANHEGTTDNSVYLDFVDIDNRGDLLFTYSSAVSTEVDPDTGEINIKIG